jgi:hypothetical protein
LGYPNLDLEYTLDTDSSDSAVGAVLSQIQERVERPIAFYSKTSSEERNYCLTRRELLAVVKACKQFRLYLCGQPFTLRADPGSHRRRVNLKEPQGQVAGWLETPQNYNFEIVHWKGTQHGITDALSQRPCTEDCRNCAEQDVTIQRIAAVSSLASDQARVEPVARLYHTVKTGEPITDEQLNTTSSELKQLARSFEQCQL